jgi:GNAT superfamily N-acetyltransferase
MYTPDTQVTEGLAEEPFSEVTLRAPLPFHLDAIVRIDAAWSGRERRAYFDDRLGRIWSAPGLDLSRVAERRGQVVGYVLGDVARGEFGRVGAVAWIEAIGVRRDQARQGVGSALLREFSVYAAALGATRVWTLLDPDDERLTDFLQAQGFGLARAKVVERNLGA